MDEVIVVGAGPAGTSAALALAAHGRAVRLLDAGEVGIDLPPPGEYLDLRFNDPQQWRWQLGGSTEASLDEASVSPKMRVPGLNGIFRDYARVNRITTSGFHLVGALAAGGLSNAWGCGVAAFSQEELAALDATQRAEFVASMAACAQRVGLSGRSTDALSDVLGVDAWADAPIPLDALHRHLWERADRLGDNGFQIGRARVAVIRRDRPGRTGCDLSGMCLWGCRRRATWSALLDIETLRTLPGVRVESGVQVQRLLPSDGQWRLQGFQRGQQIEFRASNVLLAAGTIASTRLAFGALASPPPVVRLLSNPMAAFLALVPRRLGSPRQPAFGLAQLSFVLDNLHGNEAGFGNLFSTHGLPVSEFLARLPVSRQAGLPLLKALLPAATVGNVFLPGSLSDHTVALQEDGSLLVTGGIARGGPEALQEAARRLRRELRRLGAYLLPGSFTAGAPGADLHYAGTMPMCERPAPHQCRSSGEIAGLPGVFAVDGASLPVLPATPHTLAIMANADRIASAMARGK